MNTAPILLRTKEESVPRSTAYRDKEIKTQGCITIRGTRYFKRVFFDESAELTRYDVKTQKWVHLCFKP